MKFEGISVKSKNDSWIMRTIGMILSPFNKSFMTGFWTTWFGTIYAPTPIDVNNPKVLENHRSIIMHEKVHVDDQIKHPILFPFTYIMPPILFAYGRWYWERRAYMVTLSFYKSDETKVAMIEIIVASLGGRDYLWTWPKSWMRKWFRKECGL